LTLEGLEPTQWRPLLPEEVKRLRASAVRADSPAGAVTEAFRPRLTRPLKKPRESAPRMVEARKDEGSRAPVKERRPSKSPRRDAPRTAGRPLKAKPRGQGGR